MLTRIDRVVVTAHDAAAVANRWVVLLDAHEQRRDRIPALGADRIVISVEKKGLFKGEIVLLKGKVHSDLDKSKIERIATLHAAGRKVVDDIVVVH
jgi:hypothetical protein